MTKLVIERKEWERGNGSGLLFNPISGKVCIVGGYFLITLHRPDLIYDRHIPRGWPEEAKWMLEREFNNDDILNPSAFCRLMEINDSKVTDDRTKETRIKRIFANHGDIEVEFIN